MPWIQCILETPQNNAEYCSECLMHVNAVSVTFEDAENTPLFEPEPDTLPLWDRTRVIGLFEDTVDLHSIQAYLKEQLDLKTFSSLKIESLEEKDWVAVTNCTKPIDFGHNLWIVPSSQIPFIKSKEGLKDEHQPKVRVILDAGLAFGTGTHPTTALCLKWLAANPPCGKRVLDYGCGSGILGIAARKLGAKAIIAVDHDPQALFSTTLNAEKNAITKDTLITLLPKALPAHEKVDLILANILAEPLLELAPRFAEMLSRGGIVLLSGILGSQVFTIVERYSSWFTKQNITVEEEWACIQMIKK